MKIAVEVYGVEQAMDFDTMVSSTFVVLGVFGESVRVPITEQQMEHLVARLGKSAEDASEDSSDTFEDTRVSLSGPPSPGAPKTEERSFSVMSGLDESPGDVMQDDGPREEVDPGIGGFFEEPEDVREAKLRAAARANRTGRAAAPRTVPRDEAGNPQVAQNPASNLPQIGSPVSDDDFPQG